MVHLNSEMLVEITKILSRIQLLKDYIENNGTNVKDAETKLAHLHSAWLSILAIIGD